MQDEILRLKKKKGFVFSTRLPKSRHLGSCRFCRRFFCFGKYAAKAPQDTIMMCGVRFMAETVKVLSPEKTALLANPMAGCQWPLKLIKKSLLG